MPEATSSRWFRAKNLNLNSGSPFVFGRRVAWMIGPKINLGELQHL
jgi:hypothetical protein